jgi:hypothetical protein
VEGGVGGDQDGILLMDYTSKGQTINAEYYSSLLVQLKDILKENSAGISPRGLFLARQTNWSPGTCNTLSFSPTLFSGSGLFGLPPVPWTEKTIETSQFFRPIRRSLLLRRLDWTDNLLILFVSFLLVVFKS